MVRQKILITGAGGMLGQDVLSVFSEHELVCADVRSDLALCEKVYALDITNEGNVQDFFKEHKPQWVINCAAYTNVDGAESDASAAFAVNAVGPRNLAYAVRKCGARMLHISTDYVFGGSAEHQERRTAFSEGEALSPCGIYGQSKRFGDELVQAILGDDALIVRTSWLHGVHGNNFIHTMMRLAAERESIRVVNDQFGSPTWTRWLAEVLLKLVNRGAQGIFHASSRGDISWFDFASQIVEQAGLSLRIETQTTEELGRPAPRPVYSTLDVSKLESFLGVACPSWKDAIAGHLEALKLQSEE